jgi:hypothetical protein
LLVQAGGSSSSLLRINVYRINTYLINKYLIKVLSAAFAGLMQQCRRDFVRGLSALASGKEQREYS